MSNTPRTDAAAMPIDRIDTIASRPCNVVHEDVCRQLERELAEVNEKLRQHVSILKSSDAHNNDMFCKLEKERELHSETKSELADMNEQRDTLAEALRKCILWAECMSMRCERNRDNINWSYLNDARETLAATKGESHDTL